MSNYLIGDDPSKWQTKVAEYSSVKYANAWDGVDLIYHPSATGGLEYDLVVQPGADFVGGRLTSEWRYCPGREWATAADDTHRRYLDGVSTDDLPGCSQWEQTVCQG